MPESPLDKVGLEEDRSVTALYSPSRFLDRETLKKREEFCGEVLGTHPLGGLALEVGCGMGYLSAALADRVHHVVALDRSLTHCIVAVSILYSLGRENVTIFHGSLPGLAASKDREISPRERAFLLVVSYDGLRRENLQDFSVLSRYMQPKGMALVAFPSWWFGGVNNWVEEQLYDLGLAAGWKDGDLEIGGGLEELDRGEAPPETVKLPYVAAMTGLTEVYDFKNNRPQPSWDGPKSFEVGMSWRLYHLTSSEGKA
jgi:SAM-dependent methyltransferase